MSFQETSLPVDCQAKQFEDTSNHAPAPEATEQAMIPTPDAISKEIKVLDGSFQLPTLSKSKIRRKKICSAAKKCCSGIKKGLSLVVDGLYRLFNGKMMVILEGLCHVVWISLGILLIMAVGTFTIATCAAACAI